MAAAVRFGIGIPQVQPGPRADVAALRRFLERVERLGYGSAWVLEQPIGSARTLDPTALLTYAAAVTERIRLGTAVILLPLRVPVELAKTLASLDQLSEGRLIAGVALGRKGGYAAFGLTEEARIRRFEEAVGLLRRLWTEPVVTWDGEFWHLDHASVEPKPVQQPYPPLWFGGTAPPAVRRAARLADGWIGAGSIGTADFIAAHAVLVEALEAEGRDPADFPVAKRVYVAVDDDRGRAGARLGEWFRAFYGGPELAERVAVFGPAEACAEQLAEVARGGAELIVLNPVFDEEAQAEILAAEVIPALS
jgi:probable F420-dependent oxidoreductase